MEVIHGLRSLLAIIDHDPVSVRQTLLLRQPTGRDQQMPQELLVSWSYLTYSGNLNFGDHKEMDRSLRSDVTERQALLVLIEDICRKSPVKDPREDGGCGSLRCRPLRPLYLITGTIHTLRKQNTSSEKAGPPRATQRILPAQGGNVPSRL